MRRKRVFRRLGNGTLPPTYSMGSGKIVFDGLANTPPRYSVDLAYLEEIGLTKGVRESVQYGLRWGGVIGKTHRLVDPNLPARLRNPQTRPAVFREILQTSYPKLMQRTDLGNATYVSLQAYFEKNGVTPTSSDRVVRLFMWLAHEAGIQLGERVPIITPTHDLRYRQPGDVSSVERMAEFVPNIELSKDIDLDDLTKIETEFARKLSKDYASGKTVDPEFVRQFNILVASIKGRHGLDPGLV